MCIYKKGGVKSILKNNNNLEKINQRDYGDNREVTLGYLIKKS